MRKTAMKDNMDRKTVVLDGSALTRVLIDGKWIITKCEPANGVSVSRSDEQGHAGKLAAAPNVVQKSESIGEKMVPTEYASAVTKLGGQGATTIELPQAHTNYAGKVIQVSDTHIVQRIDEGRAVAHDVSKLTNRQEILTMARAGAVNGKHFDFKYSEKQGIASVSLVQPVKSSPVAIAAAPARVAPTNDLKR